ncbi:MAG: adenosylhomocysteinase [Candidatus Omnitrophica bacterium]|nr:adenosylhomocysteinase [Candidatus Omnitrophota bacterium]
MQYDIKDKNLSKAGKKRIEWASNRMPVLELVRNRFSKEKPFKGLSIGACLHVTTETAVLALTLKEAGARVSLCASNPLSTQDDVAASLVFDYGIEVFSIRQEDTKTYYKHIESVLSFKPQITLDDGADLVSTIHKRKQTYLPWGGTEETTTGVIRLRALEKEGRLLYPIIAVNDAFTKHLFDNRYGTGQSTIDGILRATNKLISGTVFVVCGYGFCGRGIAMRAKGSGANVVVVETDPLKALEAVMDGYRVLSMKKAAAIGDIFVTATGDVSVIRKEHFILMKDKAILANSGHFNVEIDLKSLDKLAVKKREVKPFVTEYLIKSPGHPSLPLRTLRRRTLSVAKCQATRSQGKRLYVLGEGRLVNLACAEGHPAEVMDMSFANQALSCEYIAKNYDKLKKKVFSVPQAIDQKVAGLKLKAMNIDIDALTKEQKKYLSSWQEGT